MQDSRRINRIHVPSIDVTFRGDIQLMTLYVWREDRLVTGDQVYIVLDFGMEERVDFLQADLAVDEQDWRPTGRVLVEVQQLDADGNGLATPTFKEIAGEAGAVTTWHGWKLEPCSPRRTEQRVAGEPCEPVDPDQPEEVEPGETCLMCGSFDVVYHDADGTPRCSAHVGESPEAVDELEEAQ